MDDSTLRQGASRGNRAALLAIALVVAVCTAVAFRSQPPPVRPLDAQASSFSGARAMETLRRILAGEAPHPGGSDAHRLVRERITAELRDLGYAPEVQETLARGPGGRVAIVRNILARTPTGAGTCILLCAHYDSVGAGPGAGDDGAGVAAMLEVARTLAASPPLARPVILLVTDAEEAGLIGANAFAEQHPWAAEVGAVVNLEGRGTGGPSMLFETCGSNAGLIDAFASSVERPWTTSVAELVYKNMPNDTDLSVFRARGVPGFNFAFIDELWNYHTPHDDLAHLDPRSVQHHGDNALALVRELARDGSTRRPAGDAVFFDVLSAFVVRWPVSWSLPLALLGALGAAITLSRALRNGSTTVRSLGVGVLACGASALLTVGLASAISAALHYLHGVRDCAVAHPWPMRVVVGATVCLCALSIASVGAVRSAGAVALALAAYALAALLALATAMWIPQASYLFVAPCLALSACIALPSVRAHPAGHQRVVALLSPAACVSALLWFPIALAMEMGFHFQMAGLIAAPLAIIALSCLPMLSGCSRRAGNIAWSAAALALVVGTSSAALASPHSVERPGWLNLRYIDNGEPGGARWEASTFGAKLPEPLRVDGFEPTRQPPFDWLTLDRSLFQRSASPSKAPHPSLEVLATQTSADGRRLHCRLHSPRGAPRLHLHLPDRASLESIQWRGQALTGGFDGVRTQLLFAVDDDGVECWLNVRGHDPIDVWLLDQDWNMPEDWPHVRSARPAEWVPRSDGDVAIIGHRFTVD